MFICTRGMDICVWGSEFNVSVFVPHFILYFFEPSSLTEPRAYLVRHICLSAVVTDKPFNTAFYMGSGI